MLSLQHNIFGKITRFSLILIAKINLDLHIFWVKNLVLKFKVIPQIGYIRQIWVLSWMENGDMAKKSLCGIRPSFISPANIISLSIPAILLNSVHRPGRRFFPTLSTLSTHSRGSWHSREWWRGRGQSTHSFASPQYYFYNPYYNLPGRPPSPVYGEMPQLGAPPPIFVPSPPGAFHTMPTPPSWGPSVAQAHSAYAPHSVRSINHGHVPGPPPCRRTGPLSFPRWKLWILAVILSRRLVTWVPAPSPTWRQTHVF